MYLNGGCVEICCKSYERNLRQIKHDVQGDECEQRDVIPVEICCIVVRYFAQMLLLRND